MKCSVFEEDEEKPSWKAGRSVAYCEACFQEMENKAENELSGQENEATLSVSSRSIGSGQSLQSAIIQEKGMYWPCKRNPYVKFVAFCFILFVSLFPILHSGRIA